MQILQDLVKKKNGILFILILVLCIALALLYVSYQKRLQEGFQNITSNAKALLDYSGLSLDLTNVQSGGSNDKETNSPPWNIEWIAPPTTLPTSMVDSINFTYRMWQLQAKIIKDPGGYIRLDWLTGMPFTFDFKTQPTNQCFIEYKLDFQAKQDQKGKSYPVFTVQASGQTLDFQRKKCSVPVTSQFLATLPLKLQQTYINFILAEQQRVIDTKTQHARVNGRTCADARGIANGLFTPAARKAYDDQVNAKREASKAATSQQLKTAADQSLNEVSNVTKKTAMEIRNNPAVRDSIKRLPGVQALKASPYALVSAGLKIIGSDLVKKVFAGVIDLLRGGDPFAGMECPEGYVESEEIMLDPTLKAMSDIFPNPITDLTNAAVTRGICTKYIDGKADVKEKYCRYEYVLPPQRLVAAAAPARQCAIDNNIERKLQLCADWLVNITYTDKTSKFIYAIERFDYVANPSDYFVETAFEMQLYVKNDLPKVTFNEKDPLPTARTIPILDTGKLKKQRLRFYFNKNGCDYSVFGYDKDRMIFFQEWDESRAINFAPIKSAKMIVLLYALGNKIANPLDYAIQNEKNQELLLKIAKEETDKKAQIQKERDERAALLVSLNPKYNDYLGTALTTLKLEDLRERQGLLTKIKDPKYSDEFWSIDVLRKVAQEIDERNEIITLFNPAKETRYSQFYESLSLPQLRDRKREKSQRDNAINILNPLKDANTTFELNKLEIWELNRKLDDKNVRDKAISDMNPNKDIAVTTALSQLSYADLMAKYEDWKTRQPLLQYFNPTNNANLNTSYLDKFTTAQLKERQDLIKQVTSDPTTIQSLNTLDIESLKVKVKQIQDEAAAKAAAEAQRKSLGKAGWTKQQWLDSAGKEGGLPLGHDCIIPAKRSRKKCPPEYPF